MNSVSKDRTLFGHETNHARFGDVTIREVKILDQFSHHYDKSIKFFNTPQSVCGYVVSAVAPIVAESIAYISKMSEIEALLKKLNDPKFIVPEVENCMEIIQAQRTQYTKEYAHEFKSTKEKENYMRDWVATYEIGDAMEILAPSMENLLFLRFVSFQFPDLIKDLKHEEKRRLDAEEKYREHRFIIESFAEGRKFQTLEEWASEGSAQVMNTYDKPLVFIGDLTGHFLVFLACKVLREDGVLENTVFMINSVMSDYMHYEEVIMTVCKLAFPESTGEKQAEQE